VRSIASGLRRGRPKYRRDGHHVAFLEPHAITEAEVIGAEEVNVHVARPAMRLVFEVMMFQVGQRMTHCVFAAADFRLPDDLATGSIVIRLALRKSPPR